MQNDVQPVHNLRKTVDLNDERAYYEAATWKNAIYILCISKGIGLSTCRAIMNRK